MSSPNWWGDWRPTLTPHTGNLQATDLIECTSIVGGLPVNTAITGAQIIAAASSGATWGSITGTLSSQTDLQTALNAKQDTLVSATNIKTINGNSILGSGDLTVSGSNIYNADGTLTAARTLTISSSLSLTIAGTTSSRFFGNGNVGIGTTTDAGFKLNVNGTARVQSGLTISGQTANNYLTIGTGTGNAFFVWSAYFLGVNGVKFRAEGLIGDPSAAATSTRASAAIDSRGYLVTDSIGIGTTTSAINASAIAQINSTTKGFLPPRMTNAQMLAIATPAAGLVVYDTTNNKHCGYNGTAWQNFY